MKNVLQENMRRFHTKNLLEQDDKMQAQTPQQQVARQKQTRKNASDMMSWANTYRNEHGFKWVRDDQGTRIYLSPVTLKGRVELRVWNNLNDRSNDRIDINVLRQGLKQFQGTEATLYQKTITPETWNAADMPAVEGILQQYLSAVK
jgi:hypothetical protein